LKGYLKTINHRDTEKNKIFLVLISKELRSFRARLRQAIVVPSSSFGGGAAPPFAFPGGKFHGSFHEQV
jgi:hypothetical protein